MRVVAWHYLARVAGSPDTPVELVFDDDNTAVLDNLSPNTDYEMLSQPVFDDDSKGAMQVGLICSTRAVPAVVAVEGPGNG
jgi:hypothetical protein